ncbi:unnamed protein product [Parnassius apollo]|uniref:(apollo) hypothetical protein n=1 Tax=Parnassius apollo TaxID=110799 RepID=A0A8S3XH85_PARAO|nr:unnamed protein product [Parnassius apollo]
MCIYMITEEDYICEACFDVSMQSINAQIHGNNECHPSACSSRLGHTQVCPVCGRSLLNRQSDHIHKENPSSLTLRMINLIRATVAPRQDERRGLEGDETPHGQEEVEQPVDAVHVPELQPPPFLASTDERDSSVESVAAPEVHSLQSQTQQSTFCILVAASNFQMSPKVAVVTGANKGIGFAIVRGLCKRVDVVYLTSRDEERGKKAVDELNKEGLNPKYHQLDITVKKSVEVFRDYIKEKYGGIDILVNNAAIAFKNNSTEPVAVQAAETLRVNYFSVLTTCEILFPILRNSARVVNISSSSGHLSQIPSETLRNRFKDPNLTIPELSDLMNKYIEDAKKGTQAAEWGNSSYVVSKVGLTALTLIQQRLLNDRGNLYFKYFMFSS